MAVVGEASDGLEAIDKALALKPDMVLMDINMPRCDGVRATRIIKRDLPSTCIVMLTVSDDNEDIFEAIKAGAQGYLLKDMSPETLFELLKGVNEGDAPMAPSVAERILQEFKKHIAESHENTGPKVALSSRETEILQMIVDGFDNEGIASRLVIAPGTVKNHIHNILAKLQLKNRAQAVAYAVQEGLVKPHEGHAEQ